MLHLVEIAIGEFLWALGIFLELTFYYFVFAFFFAPFNLFIAHITSRIAGRFLADPDYWFWYFLILPGLGQIIFLIVYIFGVFSYKSRLKRRDLIYLAQWARYLRELILRRNPSQAPVTPFKDSMVGRILGVSAWPTDILKIWHDPQIDKLIEWRQWRPAFDLAKEQLKKARRAGDKRSAEVYRAYLMVLLPYIDHTVWLRNKHGPVTGPVASA
jgi:hypothetical protein